MLLSQPFLFPKESEKPIGGQSGFDDSYPQQMMESNQTSQKIFFSCHEDFKSVLDISRVGLTWKKNNSEMTQFRQVLVKLSSHTKVIEINNDDKLTDLMIKIDENIEHFDNYKLHHQNKLVDDENFLKIPNFSTIQAMFPLLGGAKGRKKGKNEKETNDRSVSPNREKESTDSSEKKDHNQSEKKIISEESDGTSDSDDDDLQTLRSQIEQMANQQELLPKKKN